LSAFGPPEGAPRTSAIFFALLFFSVTISLIGRRE
jgi:hypothetical protein